VAERKETQDGQGANPKQAKRQMEDRYKPKSRIAARPRAVSFPELDRLLRDYGLERRQPRSGSSHYVYTRGGYQISVPFKRPHVGVHYVKEVLKILDRIDEEGDASRME